MGTVAVVLCLTCPSCEAEGQEYLGDLVLVLGCKAAELSRL